MERKIDQFDVVDELYDRVNARIYATNEEQYREHQYKIFKKDLRVILEELENIAMENMTMATMDEPSEMRLFFGFVMGAKRVPERQRRDPRNQKAVTVPASLIPYAKFKKTFTDKINNMDE